VRPYKSGYFGSSAIPIVSASRWLRYWLTLRLCRNKITYIDKKPYFAEPLTVANKAVIFAVHLLIFGGATAGAIAGFIGLTKLIYG
jgi:hypothetical protein